MYLILHYNNELSATSNKISTSKLKVVLFNKTKPCIDKSKLVKTTKLKRI